MRKQIEAASNGSLMSDGQCGLYLITNQHSFESIGERKCEALLCAACGPF